MNKVFLKYFFVFSLSLLKAQNCKENLIPNFSFESYSNCGICPLFDSLNNWFLPLGGGSSDYFSTCSQIGCFNEIPNTFVGYQYPYDGNGFIGVAVFAKDANTNNMAYTHEYARVKLNSPLTANTKYCLSFYASLSDSANYKTNVLQALFTNGDTSIYSENIATSLAQISITKPFSDIIPVQWSLWKGSFTATGGEEYITIGNFQNDSVIDTLKINNFHYPNLYSYYFIDYLNLCICDDTTEFIPNIFSPNNDGINDVWEINLQSYINPEVNIFNRWGVKVFHSNMHKIVWDGKTTSGITLGSGVYYYIISSEEETMKGFIQLIK